MWSRTAKNCIVFAKWKAIIGIKGGEERKGKRSIGQYKQEAQVKIIEIIKYMSLIIIFMYID